MAFARPALILIELVTDARTLRIVWRSTVEIPETCPSLGSANVGQAEAIALYVVQAEVVQSGTPPSGVVSGDPLEDRQTGLASRRTALVAHQRV